MSRRPRIALLVALVALATNACHKPPAPPPDESTTPDPPVAAPDGHVLDVALAAPNALWSLVQRGTGGFVAILPATFGGLLCAATGLDASFAPEIDGTAPAFAVVSVADGKWSFALAAKLAAKEHARDALLGGDTARFEARDAGSITVVAPKGIPSGLALGLATQGKGAGSAYLLVADSESSLARLGPYVARTLPARPAPILGLVARAPRAALAGALRNEAQRAWTKARDEAARADTDQRARHGGSAPDFGDATAILASVDATVARALAIVGDLDDATLEIDADAEALHAKLTLTPAPGAGAATAAVAAMTVGDTAPLSKIAPDALVGLMTRDDATRRPEAGASLEAALAAALGSRLGPADAKKLQGAIKDWEGARGDWLTAAISLRGAPGGVAMSGALTVRTPAQDAQKASTAVRELLELATLPALEAPLRSFASVTGVRFGDGAPIGRGGLEKAGVALFQRPVTAPAKAPQMGVAWGVLGGELLVVAGADPRALLDLAGMATGKTAPATDASIQALALGTETSFAAVANPFATPSSSRTPLLLGWGRHGGNGWLQVDVSDALVREVVRRQAGL